jgi:hypothetical protein
VTIVIEVRAHVRRTPFTLLHNAQEAEEEEEPIQQQQ